MYFNGVLYGTTIDGGRYGGGTVFSISLNGRERIVHSFGASGDGAEPYSGLVVIKGVLYGTTRVGGPYGNGTLYTLSSSGAETIVHGFKYDDGSEPEGPPIAFGGAVYGTTVYGGAHNYGVVYRIEPSGAESILHSFYGRGDGTYPISNLVTLHGKMYGVTVYGGSSNSCGQGCGTVFSVEASGKEAVIHSFGGTASADGYYPQGGLIAFNGILYGTTIYGGQGGYGTVFSVTPSGTENIITSFADLGATGAVPYAGVIAYHGALFGATTFNATNADGTLFRVTPGGNTTVLHTFNGRPGKSPFASLVEHGGMLYGTTSEGGAANAGSVFRVLP